MHRSNSCRLIENCKKGRGLVVRMGRECVAGKCDTRTVNDAKVKGKSWENAARESANISNDEDDDVTAAAILIHPYRRAYMATLAIITSHERQ